MAGNPITFITLTCNPHLHASPGDAARAMTKAWRAARRKIEQQLGGKKGEYLTVVEATKRGWPHLHVLTTRRWIDQKFLSQLWEQLTGAKIVDIRRVKNQRMMISYVAKYVGKAPERFDHCKRYYFTQGFLPKKAQRTSAFDWTAATHETLDASAFLLLTALPASGYQIIEARDGYWIFEHPPPCVQPCPQEPARTN